jgi:hypothetical protein
MRVFLISNFHPVLNVVLFFHRSFNLLKPTGYVMLHQFIFNNCTLLATLYLCVLYLSENKQ